MNPPPWMNANTGSPAFSSMPPSEETGIVMLRHSPSVSDCEKVLRSYSSVC